jgi:RHS repeat-associated protein
MLLVKYTGHERDNETGLDFMQARYYGGGIGRFLSPDGPLVDQEVGDPQSWNLYSYVRNSPMGMVDPTGMFEEDPDAPKRVTKPGTSVTVTEAAILVGTVATSSITKLGEKAGEEIAKGMERAYNYFSNFQIPNLSNFCRGSYAALGASIGFFGGSAVGSLGFAGGPAGVFTTSAGAAGGTYVGTSLGIQAGNILCNSGGGGDGGKSIPEVGGGRSLSAAASKKLGNLASRSEDKVRDVIRSRGGTASNVNQTGPWADKTLREAAQAAADGDSGAETAIKIAKQAGRLGQRY